MKKQDLITVVAVSCMIALLILLVIGICFLYRRRQKFTQPKLDLLHEIQKVNDNSGERDKTETATLDDLSFGSGRIDGSVISPLRPDLAGPAAVQILDFYNDLMALFSLSRGLASLSDYSAPVVCTNSLLPFLCARGVTVPHRRSIFVHFVDPNYEKDGIPDDVMMEDHLQIRSAISNGYCWGSKKHSLSAAPFIKKDHSDPGCEVSILYVRGVDLKSLTETSLSPDMISAFVSSVYAEVTNGLREGFGKSVFAADDYMGKEVVLWMPIYRVNNILSHQTDYTVTCKVLASSLATASGAHDSIAALLNSVGISHFFIASGDKNLDSKLLNTIASLRNPGASHFDR